MQQMCKYYIYRIICLTYIFSIYGLSHIFLNVFLMTYCPKQMPFSVNKNCYSLDYLFIFVCIFSKLIDSPKIKIVCFRLEASKRSKQINNNKLSKHQKYKEKNLLFLL